MLHHVFWAASRHESEFDRMFNLLAKFFFCFNSLEVNSACSAISLCTTWVLDPFTNSRGQGPACMDVPKIDISASADLSRLSLLSSDPWAPAFAFQGRESYSWSSQYPLFVHEHVTLWITAPISTACRSGTAHWQHGTPHIWSLPYFGVCCNT